MKRYFFVTRENFGFSSSASYYDYFTPVVIARNNKMCVGFYENRTFEAYDIETEEIFRGNFYMLKGFYFCEAEEPSFYK